jgi:hypothetical protein
MRTSFKKLAVVAVLAVAAIGITSEADAQVASPTLFTITNVPATLASNVIANTTTTVQLTKNCCLSVAGRVNTSLGAGTEVLSGSFSNDGTNFGIAPFTLTATLSTTYPTNTVSVWTNWSQTYLSGFSAVQFNLVTNTGPGTATNLSWVANRSVLNTATY